MYILCARYQVDALHNNHPKNDFLLQIPLLIPDSVKLHQKSRDKPLPKPSSWYVIELGGQKNWFSPYLLPLTIQLNPTIQVCDRILVHSILVNSKDPVIGACEAISGEVSLAQ